MQHFKNIKAWERSRRLAATVYKLRLPSEERYGLTTQLRRAALSVPINIAEGSKRITGKEFARYVNIAEASLSEVECILILVGDLGLLPAPTISPIQAEVTQISKMLDGLRKAVVREA